jgi:putative ABC transport system permease protein
MSDDSIAEQITMSRLREFSSRIRGLFAKARLDEDLDEELRAHLEMLVEENLRRGMSPEEARNAARRSFGGVEQTKEAYRDQRGLPIIDSLARDVRYGFRMLRRNPGFGTVAVVTLALGIGANTAIFSVVNAVLLHSFPYRDADKLVLLAEKRREIGLIGLSYPDFVDWRSQNHVLESVGAVRRWNPNLTGEGEPERLQAAMVTAEIFPTLGISPHLGRVFIDDEDQPGAARVAILSYSFWQRRFGSDEQVIGRSLTLDQKPYTVIGVMPPRFEFWTADVWAPLGLIATEINRRDLHPGIYAIARLKPGLTLSNVRTDLGEIASQLEEAYPPTNSQIGVDAVLWQDQVGSDLRPALFILSGAVAFVLLIAGANIAGLQLARVNGRQRELAIRAALGATRFGLVRQLLVENLLLAIIGGTVGVLVVAWSLNALVSLIPTNSFTAEVRFSVDARVLAFTAIVSLATGLVFGLAPALQASRSSVNDLLKAGSAGLKPRRYSPRLRDLLITLEVAVALVLVTGAALLVKSFVSLHRVDFGFDPTRVLAIGINLPELSRDARKSADYLQAIVERVQSMPGVASASASTCLPFASMPRTGPTTLLDRPLPQKIEDVPVFRVGVVSPSYFESLRIPLLRGRYLSEQDVATTMPVAVINQTAAKRFWENDDPIGRTIQLGPPEHLVEGAIPPGYRFSRLQVVGVVGDVKYDSLDQRAEPQVYVNFVQSAATNGPMFWGSMRIAVRCKQDPMSLLSAVHSAVWAVNKDQPVSNISTIDDLYSHSIEQPRMASTLMGLLAGLAITLAAVGIYGVISYSAGERRREIGIRIAVGADARSIFTLVISRVMGFVFAGIALGILGALALMRSIEALLYGTPPGDPLIMAAVSILLACTALLAGWLPARRATKIDPMIALRCE